MADSLKLDWQVTVPVATEPVSLPDLRSVSTGSYLRVDFTDDDTVLTALISPCRADAQRMTGKTLPPELKLMLLQYIAWKNENRLGEDKGDELRNIFLGRKSWVL